MKSKVLALSAISAGITAICLTLGAYIESFDLISLVISSVFVCLPLYYKSYKGTLLTFFAGGVIAFILAGFNIFTLVFPSYFLFFGIFPIIKSFVEEKKINAVLKICIGLIWCVLYFYGAYYYYTFVMGLDFNDLPEWLWFISDNILYFIGIFGVVFFFIFDRYIKVFRLVCDAYLNRIIKK